MKKTFYVYMLIQEDGKTPFYIGKGSGGRDKSHAKGLNSECTTRKSRIIRRAKASDKSIYAIRVACGLTEEIAFELEKALICAYGRDDKGLGPLANLTDGGDGASGAIIDEEHRRAISERSKLLWQNPEHRAAFSAKMLGRPLSDAHKRATSSGRKGMKFTEEHIKNMKLARVGKKQSEAHKAAISAAKMGKKLTDEHKANMSKARYGKVMLRSNGFARNDTQLAIAQARLDARAAKK